MPHPSSNLWVFSADALNQWLGTHWRTYLITVSLLCVVTFAGYSHVKVPWNDEVLQLHIARQDTVKQVWDTMRAGTIQIDPPPLHILGHILIKTFGDHVILIRAASIVGFLLLCVSLSLLLRRHVPPIYAAAGFFMPYATVLRSRVPDARPYAMMIGFSALALLCWDALNDDENSLHHRNLWRAGFCLSLAAMLSTHFFSILFFTGLGVAELVKWYLRKRLDWVTLALMALSLLPYFFWLPSLFETSHIYMRHYFFPVKFQNFYDFYSFAIHSLPIAGILLLLAFLLAVLPTIDRPDPAPLSTRMRILLAASAGFLLVPAAGYFVGLVATGVFVNYYHIVATFGVIIGVPLVLVALSGGSRIAGLALFLAVLGHGLFVTTRGVSGFRRVDTTYPTLEEMRKIIPEPNPDIVVASPLHFLPLQEATRSDPQNNLVYLYDTQKALAALGTDTADLCHYYLKRITRARIEPFEPWLAQHPTFYIAVLGETVGIQEWQFDYLLRESRARLTWIGQVHGFRLYRVNHTLANNQ